MWIATEEQDDNAVPNMLSHAISKTHLLGLT